MTGLVLSLVDSGGRIKGPGGVVAMRQDERKRVLFSFGFFFVLTLTRQPTHPRSRATDCHSKDSLRC